MQRFRRTVLVGVSMLVLCREPAAIADGAPALPPPTGPHAVGRVTYGWTDSNRGDVLAADPAARRELVVDVWYPADPSPTRPAADYLPDFASLRTAVGEEALRSEFGLGYAAVAAGKVRTHTVENAPFASRLDRRPVLVFSHGFGVLSRTYTAQLEDLASHGYVVAAIAHTYETMATVFPDGRVVPFATETWKAATGSEESSIAYGNVRTRCWADDMSFVLDELEREDRRRPRRAPFAGHVDLSRAGAFGHSSGGRAAALACANDRRVKACLNQDGLVRMLPFDRVAVPRLERPFLLFRRPRPKGLPPDDELARMGLTRSSAEALLKELHAAHDAAMDSTGPGSYRVTLGAPGMSHASFCDQPVLQAADDSGKRDEAIRNLETIRSYVRAFFDRSLRGARDTLLDRKPAGPGVEVDRFPRTRRRD